MSTDIGTRLPGSVIDNTNNKKINAPSNAVNNQAVNTPVAKPDIPSNSEQNNSVNLTPNITKQSTAPQVIEFSNAPSIVSARDINVRVEDIDGIDTNSKNDLRANISGTVTFSKQGIEDSLKKLEKMINDKMPDVNIKLEANPATNEYTISINKGVRLGSVSLKMGNGGIDTKIELSGWTKAAGYLISPLAMLAFRPEKMITDYVKNTLSKDIGMTVNSIDSNEFRMIPDFKSNQLLKEMPVGNMKMHLENVTGSNSNFRLDNSGNMIMDLNVQGIASSNPYAGEAKDEGIHDVISGKVDADYKTDGSTQAELKQGRLELNITPEESAGLRQQLDGFGQKGITASGQVTVSDVDIKTFVNSQGKIQSQEVDSGHIQTSNLKFDQGANHVDLKSTQGNIDYKPQSDGSFTAGINGGVTGSMSVPGAAVNINDLNINGKMTYTPAKPATQGQSSQPANYRLESDTITAKSVNVNNDIKVDNLNVKDATLDLNPNNGNVTLTSKPNGIAKVNSLKIASAALDFKNINFRGAMTIEPTTGKVTLDSNSLNFKGNIAGINLNLNPARGANFSGRMVYAPASGVTITGSNGKKSASVTNLSGDINGFKIDGLTATGGLKVDNSGNLSLVNAGHFRLNAEGLQASGNNMKLSKTGDVITTNSSHNKFNLTQPASKGKPAEKIVKDLVMDGNINYNTKTNNISFNNPSGPVKFKSGSIEGVSFNNFQPKGDIQLSDNNRSIILQGPASFEGTANINGVSLSNFNSDQAIKFYNDGRKSSIEMSGNVQAEIKLPKQTESTKLATSGNISMSQEGDNLTVVSENGSITGKFGNIDLENFKFQGKVLYNTRTQEMKLEKLNDQTDLTFAGKLNGADVDIKSPSGTIGMKKEGEDYVVSLKDTKLSGKVGNINLNTPDKGLSGDITIPPDGKAYVKNLDMDIDVEGVKFTAKGNSGKTENGGYQIDLSSGGIQADNGKVSALIDKIADSPFASSPETKKKLADLKQTMSKIDLTKLKYENFKIDFDKDMNYKLNVTATDINLDIPERNFKLQNTPPGKVTLNMDSNNKVSVSSQGTNINASIGGTQFQNFNIKGSLNYEPANNGEPERITLSKDNLGINSIEVQGSIKFSDDDIKKVNIKANADVSMVKKGSDLEVQGNNLNIDGMFDGFNVKSLPTEGANTPDPTYASGKVTIKKDGNIDISDLKFKMMVDGIAINNNAGSITSSNSNYELKISGDVATDINKFTAFMKKLASNSSVPDSAKESITRTVKDLQNFVLKGDVKDAKYKEIAINFDKEFNVKDFHVETSASITNAKVKLDMGGVSSVLNFDKIDLAATSQSKDEKNLYIKNGTAHFSLTDNFKASVSDAVKNIMSQSSGIPLEKMKDVKVDMTPEGKIVIGGTMNYKSFINVDIGANISIDGTKVSVEIDKTRLKGFFGLIQAVVQPVTGKAENIITDKIVDGAAKNVKIEYAGKENVFSIDLQNIFSRYVNDNAKLTNIDVKNNEVNVSYEVTYGSERNYNLGRVQSSSDQLNSVAYPPNKDQKPDPNQVTANIIALPANELSATFNRTSIVPDLVKHLGEKNDLAIMKKLADNINVGNNADHLREFINEKNISKKVLQYFLKSLTREQYDSLPQEVSDALKVRLVK